MYLSKRKSFSILAVQHGLDPFPQTFNYLLHLKQVGLLFGSIKVHLLVILACHLPIESCLGLYSFQDIKFLKWLLHTHQSKNQFLPGTSVRLIWDLWSLHLNLCQVVPCTISLQTVFLMVITSARNSQWASAIYIWTTSIQHSIGIRWCCNCTCLFVRWSENFSSKSVDQIAGLHKLSLSHTLHQEKRDTH